MNGKITIDQLVLKNLYYRYRAFVTPLATIFICILLFFFVIIPQIQNWLSLRDTLTVNTQNLQILHQNLSFLTSLDDAQLNQQLSVATKALPAEKDFAGIVTALQVAASIAGADLGDYSFNLGDLSGQNQKGQAAQLPVQLNILLKGNIAAAQRFVAQLRNQLPLSDTISLVVSTNTSITATVVFYYAALPKTVFQDTTPLPVLGSSDRALLTALANGANLQQTTLASPSAAPRVTTTPTPTIAIPTPGVATSSAATSSAR